MAPLRARPGLWALALILLAVAYLVLSIIPLVNIFLQLLLPFANAGIALAADQQRRTGTFELDALLGGFKKQPVSLLAVGGTVILAGIVFPHRAGRLHRRGSHRDAGGRRRYPTPRSS